MGIFILTGCEKAEEEMKPVSDMTIAEYAGSDANFSILVQVLTKADLVNILNGTGNFTVFAPTNAAFTSLFLFCAKDTQNQDELINSIIFC